MAAARDNDGRKRAARASLGWRWRGYLVGLVLLPLNTLWLLWMEKIGGEGVLPTTISLFFNVIFVIFFLALANLVARRLRPRWALTQAQMVVVYVMLTISSSVVAYDNMQVMVPSFTHAFWFANPTNRWDQLFANAPPWLVVSNQQVLYQYYNGSSTMYQALVLRAWLPPVLWWTGFVVVLTFVMICLSVLVRAQWADRERLTFPIIQLPLAITEPATALWRNRLLWIGFSVAGAVDLVNGLHYVYPSLPFLSVAPTVDNWGGNDLVRFLPDLPWSAIGWLPATFYPAVIGICFLVPLDLLFSCVAFFFWWKLMYVLAAAIGVSRGWGAEMSESVFPYANHQMFGGYLAIAIGPMLIGRGYFRAVWRRILGRPSGLSDSEEGMSYRLAAMGTVVGIGLLVAFSVHAGQSLRIAIIFFLIYYLLAVAVARVRAEFGSPVHDFHFAGPNSTIVAVAGTSSLRHRDLTLFGLLWWLNRAYRGHAIGHTIEGVQMAARTRSSGRPVAAAMVVATLLGSLVGFWVWLHFAYRLGVTSKWSGGDWQGSEVAAVVQSWVQNPTHANLGALVFMGVGFAITLLLGNARSAIVGWPLHPVAYALAASWSIHLVWMPMVLALIAKWAVLRYGGLGLYLRAVPFFFGLILGETIIGLGWTFVTMIWHTRTYGFWGL